MNDAFSITRSLDTTTVLLLRQLEGVNLLYIRYFRCYFATRLAEIGTMRYILLMGDSSRTIYTIEIN
jgi:hypothetical protein